MKDRAYRRRIAAHGIAAQERRELHAAIENATDPHATDEDRQALIDITYDLLDTLADYDERTLGNGA